MSDPAHAQTLETMFLDHKRLFVDLLGWDVPIVDGRFEMDRFDGPAACYLIACDDAGDHVGSMRLLPTIQPHILDTLFAELCEDSVPRGPDIFEITRLCLPVRLGATERLRVRNLLISAMIDHALEERITALTGVVQADFRLAVLAMGWECAGLGAEVMVGRQLLGAFRLEIGADTPERVRATGIYSDGARALPACAAPGTAARGADARAGGEGVRGAVPRAALMHSPEGREAVRDRRLKVCRGFASRPQTNSTSSARFRTCGICLLARLLNWSNRHIGWESWRLCSAMWAWERRGDLAPALRAPMPEAACELAPAGSDPAQVPALHREARILSNR